MTIVVTRHLNQTTITSREIDMVRSWSDWHQYIPTQRDRVEQKGLKIRSQVNGLHAVDDRGRFTSVTAVERCVLMDIFDEAQDNQPVKKGEGVYRSTMNNIEDCALYSTLGRKLNEDGVLVDDMWVNDQGEERTTLVQTDVPRRMMGEEVDLHAVPVSNMADWVQMSQVYQLREFSMGKSHRSSDWSEWHMDATLYQEQMLIDLGFEIDDINTVRQMVCDELPHSGTHFSCTYEAWDVFMAEDRALWALDYISDSWKNNVQPHREDAMRYIGFCRHGDKAERVSQFIVRYVEHRVGQAEDMDRDEWFKFMCDGVTYVQKRVQHELGAPGYCSDKAAWIGFMKWTQGMFWHSYREMTVANKARFEVKPSDEQRQAIGYMMWLERLVWENEMAAKVQHIDNWCEEQGYQREERQTTEFDSMWELNQTMR